MEFLLALVIGLIAMGIVVAVLRDTRRQEHPEAYRRRIPQGQPEAPEPRVRRGVADGRSYTEEAQPAAAARVERRGAPAAGGLAVSGEGAESRGGLLLPVAAVGAAAALLFAIVVQPWEGSSATDEEAPAAGTAAGETTATATVQVAGSPSTATATATRTSTPAPPNAATLTVQARQQANVRVTVDGRIDYEGVLQAGESRSWAGGIRVQLWTDNGKNVVVTVNGFDLGALSPAVGHPEWNTVDWGWAAGWRP